MSNARTKNRKGNKSELRGTGGIDLLGDGSVAWSERWRHGGGGDVADLGQSGGEEQEHEEKLESVGCGRAEARERGEPVVPGGEELVAGQPGGGSPRRRNETPQKAPHGHGWCPRPGCRTDSPMRCWWWWPAAAVASASAGGGLVSSRALHCPVLFFSWVLLPLEDTRLARSPPRPVSASAPKSQSIRQNKEKGGGSDPCLLSNAPCPAMWPGPSNYPKTWCYVRLNAVLFFFMREREKGNRKVMPQQRYRLV